LKLKYIFLSVIAINGLLCADDPDVEIVRNKIARILTENNPKVLPEFFQYSDQYDKLVFDFFDINNKLPLVTHIQLFDENLKVLTRVIDNPEFSSARTYFQEVYPKLIELIAVLKNQIGSRNYGWLGLKVRRFKFLLPLLVRNRGEISLLWSLRHRVLS
jgi:hypothetical protein